MSAQNNSDGVIAELLEGVASAQGFQNYQLKKDNVAVKGDGFLGAITTVEMTGVGASDATTLSLIVKSALKSNALRARLPITDAYRREIYMYKTVIPILQRFVTDRGLPQFSSLAKCYAATAATNGETLILENLKAKQFKQWDRRLPMDDDHFAMIAKQYGRFHGISFAYKDKDPVGFHNLTKSMDDILGKFFAIPDFMKMVVKQGEKAEAILDSGEMNKAFRNFLNEAPDFIKGLSKLPNDYSVILHGDCWTNNFLFKYDDATATPTDMCFIDLQMSRLGPPVLDFAHFFYACSSKTILDNHQHYLDLYYNSLAKYVTQLGSNPDDVYPRRVFLQQWKEFVKYGMVIFIMVIQTLLSEQDEIVNFDEVADSGKSLLDLLDYDISNADVFKERVQNIVSHFFTNNYF